MRKNNINDLNEGLEYDVNDPWTWNYKTVSHVGGWRGCYMYNFKTITPHLTPWHMLGHSTKPDWWDNLYAWDDQPLRQNLINLLKKSTYNDLYKWDWDTACPVNENGDLVYPNLILGSPEQADAAEEFTFGDWSPIETEWRLSSIGQAVTLDAMLKLNPSKMWNRVFNVDTFIGSEPKTSFIDGNINSQKSSIIHGHGVGKKVKEVKLINSADIFADYGDTLKMFFVTDEYIKHAELDVEVVDGKVQSINLNGSGSGYEMMPNIVLVGTKDGNERALGGVEYTVVMEDNNQWVCGLSQIQNNYLLRNGFKKT